MGSSDKLILLAMYEESFAVISEFAVEAMPKEQFYPPCITLEPHKFFKLNCTLFTTGNFRVSKDDFKKTVASLLGALKSLITNIICKFNIV